MKTIRTIAIAAAAACLNAGMALAADPLEGYWRTATDDNGKSGLVQVAPCGNKLCGTLVKSFDASGNETASPNIGRNIISQTVPAGGGKYQGKVYSPDRDKTYNSKLVLQGDQLKVSGCVLFVCRDGGTWRRVK